MKDERTKLLLGETAFARLQNSFVAVAGLGGVGGHCAEALARAGVGRLHLIDFDRVSESNMNRQLIATRETVGTEKTEAMRARLLSVSDCAVTTSSLRIDADTVADAIPADADFIVDAIDSLTGKLAIIDFARAHGIMMVSCMGAGNRTDASRFAVTDVFSTSGDPLARRMRAALRKMGVSALPVVCSDEPPHTQPGQTVIGSLAPVTAAAGLVAASYAIMKLTQE